MELISAKNVSVKYDARAAVRGASFSVSEGDYLCIVGENGTGKSTLLKAILGLVRYEGEISFENGLKRSDLGYLPQQTQVQKGFPASVYEVVLSGCLNRLGRRLFYSAEEKDAARESMRLLGLTDIANRSYRELSGGQQQRTLVARAVCSAKKMIFLDEPVNGLDPTVSRQMYDVIGELNAKQGMTVVMVSHDIDSAVRRSNMILHMDTEVRFFGPSAEYASKFGYKFFQNGGY